MIIVAQYVIDSGLQKQGHIELVQRMALSRPGTYASGAVDHQAIVKGEAIVIGLFVIASNLTTPRHNTSNNSHAMQKPGV